MVRPEEDSVKRLLRDLRCSLSLASKAVATCWAAPPCTREQQRRVIPHSYMCTVQVKQFMLASLNELELAAATLHLAMQTMVTLHVQYGVSAYRGQAKRLHH